MHWSILLRKVRTSIAALILAVLHVGIGFTEAPPKHAIAGWRAIEKELETLSGTITMQFMNEREITEFAFLGQLGKAETSQGIELFNNEHAFKLSRSKTSESKWSLANVRARRGDEIVNALGNYAKASVSVANTRLLDMVDNLQYEFRNWSEKNNSASCTLVLKVDENLRLFDSIDVEFDIDHQYRVSHSVGSKKISGGTRITESTYSYDSLINVPTRITSSYRGTGQAANLEFNFENLSTTPKPASEFSLAFYGLPDYQPPRKPFSRLFIFTTFAVILLLSTMVYIWLKRKG